MKKIIGLTALLMAASVLTAVTASAAEIPSDQIKKGTPVIDGQMDEIYLQSAAFAFDEGDIGAVYDTWGGDFDHTAAARFLWDDGYFYMFIQVDDTDVFTHGQEYIDANANPWMNDAVESWFMINDSTTKVHNDAFGYTMFQSPEGIAPAELFDIENSVYKTVATDKGYSIEVAFKPLDALTAGQEIGFCIQLNDIQTAEAETIYCSGSQHPEEYLFTLSAEEVVPPVVEEPAEEAPAEDAPADAPAAEAPVTADAGVIAALGLMAVSAGVVLTKKK